MQKVYKKPEIEISTLKQVEVLRTSAEVDSSGIGLDFSDLWGGGGL